MKSALERLSKVKEAVCVSIILETHKTHPDNQKDSILLKNLITQANQRLEKNYGAGVAKTFTDKLNSIANKIDHNHNDNGLLLFASETVAEYVRIPTHPTTRVIIADTFATRPIIRALKKDTDYYILALSLGKARLIEASSNDLIKEVEDDRFPITENRLQTGSNDEAAIANRITNLRQEFFNRIDKAVNAIRSGNPLPVIVYAEETNYNHYLKEADYPNTILGHVLLKNFNDKAANLVKEIWPFVRDLTVAKNRARISELKTAVSNGNYFADLNEIWNAVQDGRGNTLFVEEGYHQPVKNTDGVLMPVDRNDENTKPDIDDVIDEIIEFNLKFGGDVVFLKKDTLENFNQIALITRY